MAAARHARLDLTALADFMAAWEGSLSQGAVVLPPGTVEGELAPEFKLDLMVPAFGRIGPIGCQIIQRMPDGGVAARIPEMPAKVGKVAERLSELVKEARAYLLATGALVEPGAASARAPQSAGGAAPAAAAPAEVDSQEATAGEGPAAQEVEDATQALAAGELAAEEPAAREPAARELAAEEPAAEVPATEVPADEEPAAEEPAAEEPAAEEPAAEEPAAEEPAPPARRPRGFPIPKLTGAPAYEGPLGDRSLRAALMSIAAAKQSGVLHIEPSDGGPQRYGYWIQGGPVGWRAAPEQDAERLGALLAQAGQLDADTHARAEALMESQGIRLGQALVRLELVTAVQLVQVLGRQVEHIFKLALSAQEGRWRFFSSNRPPAGDFLAKPVHVASSLYRTLAAHAASAPPASVRAAIKARGEEWVQINPDLLDVLATGRWSRGEQALLLAVRRRPAQARVLLNELDAGTAGAIALLSFVELGLLQMEKSAPSRVQVEATAAINERIEQKHKRVETDHHFDALEVHWAALGFEIDAAYEARRMEFDRGQLRGLDPAQLAMADRISDRLREAHMALRDAHSRARYRDEVIDPDLVLAVAERFAKEAEAAAGAGDAEKARSCWARAVEIAPGEPSYARSLRAAGG